MLKRLLTILLACALFLPACSAAENTAAWSEADIGLLAVTEERYRDLISRAAENGNISLTKVKNKYASMFTACRPMDMIRSGIESGDINSYLKGYTIIRQLQQLDCFSAANSAWLDKLFAEGDIRFITGSPVQALAMISEASLDPALEPVLTWSFRVFDDNRKSSVSRLKDFLMYAGYTDEEYLEDSAWASVVFSPVETHYVCMPDGTAALLRYGGGEEYEVLSEYEGCPVTVIGPRAFQQSTICSVTLPDTLTTIGEAAFGSAPLKAIRIPDSVTEIGEGAFAGCLLESVDLPAGLTEISAFSFAANPYLHSLTIPEGIRSIGMSAFSMSGLPDELVIPGSVETIGEYAFSAADPRIARYMNSDSSIPVLISRPVFPESILTPVIENGVKNIEKYAFAGRPVEDVFLPESVESVGECAFTGNSFNSFSAVHLKSISVAPENPVLRSIDGSLFDRGGERLILCVTDRSAYTVPDGTRTIGRNAFEATGSPASIMLPESLTALEDFAFAGCAATEPILIPAGVTEIGKYAFYANNTLSWLVSILVYPGSYAEQFCLEYGFPFATAP